MGAVTVRQSPTDVFVAQVLPPEKRRDIASALPAHVPIARFERNLVNALMQNPDLLQCDPRLVFREVSKLAALGLLMDPQLGEAYLITGWNARKGCKEPQSRVGYRGLIKLARQSGDIARIYAHEVCAADQIECELGVDKKLIHKPDIFSERGDAIGYYAVVHFKDGGSDFEPMNAGQVNRIRDRSDGWKAFKAGKIKSTPWGTDYDEMAKKTVLRRLLKRLPASPDLAAALAHEDNAEEPREPVDITPLTPAGAVAAALTANDQDEPDQQYGEVIESVESTGEPSPTDASEGAADTSQDPAPQSSEAPPSEATPLDPEPWSEEECKDAARFMCQQIEKLKTIKAVDNYMVTSAQNLAEIKRASEAAHGHVTAKAEAKKAALALSV